MRDTCASLSANTTCNRLFCDALVFCFYFFKKDVYGGKEEAERE